MSVSEVGIEHRVPSLMVCPSFLPCIKHMLHSSSLWGALRLEGSGAACNSRGKDLVT